MAADVPGGAVARIAAGIGDPARSRMLYALMGGTAHTATELALVAGVTPSTASVHLARLTALGLVDAVAQGRHRYFRLAGRRVAGLLEALSVLAGGAPDAPEPATPPHLRAARTCYDHIAGALGVTLHDRLLSLGWLAQRGNGYTVTARGQHGFAELGVNVAEASRARRKLASACLDWSERRPHLGGALGAALLGVALERRWVRRERGSRALAVTPAGRRELRRRFGLVAAG